MTSYFSYKLMIILLYIDVIIYHIVPIKKNFLKSCMYHDFRDQCYKTLKIFLFTLNVHNGRGSSLAVFRNSLAVLLACRYPCLTLGKQQRWRYASSTASEFQNTALVCISPPSSFRRDCVSFPTSRCCCSSAHQCNTALYCCRYTFARTQV